MSASPAPNPNRASDAIAGVVDPLWSRVRSEAESVVRDEPQLASFFVATILNHGSLEAAVAHRVATRLGHASLPADLVAHGFREAFEGDPELGRSIRADIAAVMDRDPATTRALEPVLYFKGFHALQAHRLAHWYWNQGRRDLALYLQSRSSEVFQTDIHPAARIGRGVFLDHATGLVVGSTAVVEDDVSILHAVTLGGTGKQGGDRHPKIRRGVMIGAGAKILGNIEVGACARVAAGSVVLRPVPPHTTVVGVPARVVGTAGCAEPARSMDQLVAMTDYIDIAGGI
ncbi:serine O-acetyltransferase [Methylobacterium haplocladii]|uniref:Serine acetyltransferase n=1 Tax=Methylobacterium haplocladii TaxID=1176176 RepID=A0A512IUF2_9HYPH|nr:serine O-acetyltransferase [Methylobacterium haplocladii]GEP01338.1 serine O-acetyltransferase [Methylobacterium haplocladii]GJD83882.1 Serine acetyltransferase [Methylobacterium haplocladii]GLS59959.1 serine O-acetyltransferase [Methylobacterium haplocladii]